MRASNVDTVEVVEVIKAKSLFGEGIEGDPYRTITEYYDLTGALLARHDTWKEENAEG